MIASKVRKKKEARKGSACSYADAAGLVMAMLGEARCDERPPLMATLRALGEWPVSLTLGQPRAPVAVAFGERVAGLFPCG